MSLSLGTSGQSEYFWKLETCVNFWHVLCTARKTEKDRASGSFANGELCQTHLITFVRQQSAVCLWHVERIMCLETRPANIRWYLIWSASRELPALAQTFYVCCIHIWALRLTSASLLFGAAFYKRGCNCTRLRRLLEDARFVSDRLGIRYQFCLEPVWQSKNFWKLETCVTNTMRRVFLTARGTEGWLPAIQSNLSFWVV